MRKLFFIIMAVLASTFMAQAQTRTVKGVVLNAADSEPLIGVSVLPLGGGQGAATDLDGKFTLHVPASVKQVKFSYVGFEPMTVAIKDNMVVKMKSSEQNLEDVIVVAYGTATKESLTGSVAVVNSKEIEKRPVNTITTALEGLAPGVQVSSTTAAGPAGAPEILIRGINTVNGTNAPIYVVDGVIFNGSISDINPEDVESMSVLKDAASCALYGSKGANGVILITTRKAKDKGKVDVTLKINQGIYQRGLPFYDQVDSNQWMETMLTSLTNGQASLSTSTGVYADYLPQTINSFFNEVTAWNIYGVPSNEIFDANGKVTRNPLPGYTDLNWWDPVSQNGHRQEYNVSVAAAQDKFNVFASTGYLKSAGYIVNTDYERFSSRINLNATPVSFFRFGLNANLSYDKAKDSGTDSSTSNGNAFASVYRAPVLPYYDHNVETGEILYDADGRPEWNLTEGINAFDQNIAFLLRNNKNNYDKLVASLSVNGAVILPYGFEVGVRGDMFRSKQTYKVFGNPYLGNSRNIGRLEVSDYATKSYNFMQTITWDHNYGDHHVDVLLDHENYKYQYTDHTQELMNMVFFDGELEYNNFKDNEGFASSLTERTTESYLGRARYNYDQKYFAEASFRRDGTSRFAKKVRWGSFWSVGASWVLSKEKFLQDQAWINYLKLRASYGTAGSDAAASAYAYWSTYGTREARVDGNLVTYPRTIGSDQAKWESVKTLDIALEGTLFNNRFDFSIGYFLKKNSDLLYNVTQPASAGGTWAGSSWSILTNIGTMQNVGWELSFRGDVIKTKDFTWSLNLDASFIKNKLTKLPATGNQWTPTLALIEGKTRYEYYMPTYAGVDMATGRALYEINPTSHTFQELNAETGQWEFSQSLWDSNIESAKKAGAYVEIDGKSYTNRVTYASDEFQGTTLPTVFGSFGTSLQWKGISLSALFTYSLGGKLYDSKYSSLMSYAAGKSQNFHPDIFNSWTEAPEGLDMDNASARINKDINPQVNSQYSSYDNATSSRWLTSASYLQFKNLAVSYSFPKVVTEPLKLQGLNLGFSVENLFTATKRKGINPASSYAGDQYDYFVVSRVFSFNLTARF